MEPRNGSGREVAGLQPVVSKLGSTVREARVHVQGEVTKTEPTASTDEIRTLQRELRETRRELRRLEQYVVALEERIDEG
jgi:predicted  nucleic acid-binding Zn-ribbon protein